MIVLMSFIIVLASLLLVALIYLYVRKYVAELGKSNGKDAFIKDKMLK